MALLVELIYAANILFYLTVHSWAEVFGARQIKMHAVLLIFSYHSSPLLLKEGA